MASGGKYFMKALYPITLSKHFINALYLTPVSNSSIKLSLWGEVLLRSITCSLDLFSGRSVDVGFQLVPYVFAIQLNASVAISVQWPPVCLVSFSAWP